MKSTDLNEMETLTPIQKYFVNSNIFITGATGFIGKYLMEKFLRSCTGFNKIYILLRPKKGKTIEQRFDTLFEDPIFETVRKQVPNFREKFVLVSGDLNLPNLGISTEDQHKLIDSIDVVLHSAATVRFFEPILNAIRINVIATRDLLLMARQMKNLKSFVYISTAYSNCNQKDIAEKVYETKVSGDDLIKLANSLDETILEKMTPALVQDWPNTYTFTKAVAEDCVRTYGKGLPVCIVRPPIVGTTAHEPVPGWTDSINGITGHCFAYLTGYLRVSISDFTKTFDIVPVDMTGNFIMAAAWNESDRQSKEIKVYNYVSSHRNPVNCEDLYHYAMNYGAKCPTKAAGGYYFQLITKHITMYKILTFIFHIIPAVFIDLGLKLSGQKPKALALYDKVHKFMIAISHFTTHEWHFEERNTMELLKKMDLKDQKIFYADLGKIIWADYFWHLFLGVRLYLLKEDPSTIPEGLKRQEKLKKIHYVIVYSLVAILLYLAYKLFSLFL